MKNLDSKKIVGLSIASALLIIFSAFTIWLNSYIFNGEAFVSRATEITQSEEVRYAVASEIVGEVLNDKPVTKNIVSEPLTKAIAGLLDSSLTKRAVERLSSQVFVIITSDNPESATINTEGVKSIVTPIVKAIDPSVNGDVQEINIPDEIVVINADDLPSIAWMTNLIWIGQILGIIGVGVIIAMIWIARNNYKLEADVLKSFGVVLAVSGIVSAMIIPTLEPSVITAGPSANIRLLISAVFRSFTNVIVGWYWALTMLGVLITAVGFGFDFYLGSKKKSKK